MTMHNHEMYYALVDNDVAGLAAAFDHYAADLYAYCQSQLAEPADAADAVHDTFVIAASKITKLSEPDRLRSWLFAVTRNECHSRVQAGISVAAEMTYDSISLAGTSLEVQLRALVWAALARLEPVERELIELNLRHELRAPTSRILWACRATRRRRWPNGLLPVHEVARRAIGRMAGPGPVPGHGRHPGWLGRQADRTAAQAARKSHPAVPGVRQDQAPGN